MSNLGRVRSLEHERQQRTRGGVIVKRIYPGRILKLQEARAGYMCAHLSDCDKTVQCFVHRLVAEAFIEKPKGCDIVNHLDCNPKNNRASNLEWTTYKGNMQHASKLGRMGWQPENLKKAVEKLKRPVYAIKDGERLKFDSQAEAARALGINGSHISEACQNPSKTSCGYKWEYA